MAAIKKLNSCSASSCFSLRLFTKLLNSKNNFEKLKAWRAFSEERHLKVPKETAAKLTNPSHAYVSLLGNAITRRRHNRSKEDWSAFWKALKRPHSEVSTDSWIIWVTPKSNVHNPATKITFCLLKKNWCILCEKQDKLETFPLTISYFRMFFFVSGIVPFSVTIFMRMEGLLALFLESRLAKSVSARYG